VAGKQAKERSKANGSYAV
jgi:DNA-binding HxlR family transcriptional regulator